MRAILGALGLGMLAFAVPGKAATIVQDFKINLPLAENRDFEPSGYDFNPALGTLDSVTAVLTGSGAVRINAPSPVSGQSASGVEQANVGSYPTEYTKSSPVQLVVSGGGSTLTGNVVGENVIASLDPSDFISVNPNPIPDIVDGGIAVFPAAGGGWGAYSEDLSFTGDITLTYTYHVPEPSALVVLGTGLIGMTLLRRRGSL